MESAAVPSTKSDPRARRGSRDRSGWSRLGLVVGVALVASLAGAPPALALAFAAVAAGSAWFEAAAQRRAAARQQAAAVHAARVEGQHDATGLVGARELAYERLRSVLEALGEGIVVVEHDGRIVLANPAARRALAQPLADPIGRVLWEALTPDLAARAQEAFAALRDGAGGGGDALPLVRYSGLACRDRIYDLTAVGVTSRRTGHDFGTVFLLVDSTRTHELQRIKDRFLSNVSHELRTPLTNICAYAELLGQMASGDLAELPEFVTVIHDESVELSRLVDALFDYLQLESGEAVFAQEILDGVETVRNVVTQALPKAHARRIRLDLRVTDHPPLLQADRRRFEQVVRHLVDNALKFSPQGGHVAVAVAGRDEGFELRVDDNGPGVPRPARHVVFEKFSQLSTDLTDKTPGTGIGLATSRAIVARFGGLIWCEDSPIGGAAFVVLLPGLGQPKLAGFGAGTGAGGGF